MKCWILHMEQQEKIKIMKTSMRMTTRRMFEKEYVWINVLSWWQVEEQVWHKKYISYTRNHDSLHEAKMSHYRKTKAQEPQQVESVVQASKQEQWATLLSWKYHYIHCSYPRNCYSRYSRDQRCHYSRDPRCHHNWYSYIRRNFSVI
jgi:hypothetical protein